MRRRTALLAIVATLGLGVLLGSWAPDDTFFEIKKNFSIFGRLYEEVATNYVDPVEPEQLMQTGINAMLRTLDPYTVFIDQEENEEIDIITEGSYGGVGVSVGVRDGEVTVIAPMEGYSAYEQGMRAGDVITHIDSTAIEDLSMNAVQNMLRGEAGTTVHVRVRREGSLEPLRFELTRERVRLRNVTYSGYLGDPADGLGYVRLERFARQAPEEVRGAIDTLRRTGNLRGLVLDLRGNPGGLLESAVGVSDLFLPSDRTVVTTRGRDSEDRHTYESDGRPVLEDLPLAVLVDESSASASEIVAGAVQDYDRGIILGERTFGKGLVQVIKSLPYNTSLKMTVSKYYTPSGRSIQSVDYRHDDENGGAVDIPDSLRQTYTTRVGRQVRGGGGIEPDVEIPDPSTSELQSALQRKSAFFLFANHYAAEHDSVGPSFTVSDSLLRAFESWLDDQSFSYETQIEQTVGTLEEHLTASAYEETTDELAALRREIAEEKNADFQRHADRLKEQLREQILARYAGQSVQIEASLRTDRGVQRAAALLEDGTAYEAVLTPGAHPESLHLGDGSSSAGSSSSTSSSPSSAEDRE